MKNNCMQNCLISTVLSFALGFGSIACMVTGLSLDANLTVLALGCLLVSGGISFLLCIRWGGRIALTGTFAFLIVTALTPSIQEQFLSLLWDVLSPYQMMYGLVLRDSLQEASHAPYGLILLTMHSIIALACVWTIHRRCTVSLAVVPALLPLIPCFVQVDTVPALEWVVLWIFALILLLMTHPVRVQNAGLGIRLTKLLAIPTAAAVLALTVLIPPNTLDIPAVGEDSIETLWDWITSKIPSFGTTSDGDFFISFPGELSDSVDLGALGPRPQQNTPVMEITPEFSGPIYLRGRDFDDYTGLGWNSTPNRKESDFHLPATWYNNRGSIHIRTFGRQNHYFVPCYPRSALTFTDGYAPNDERLEEYDFACTVLPARWTELWQGISRIPSRQIDPQYLALPEPTFADATAILEKIAGLAGSDTLRTIYLIGEYVRDTARYDLNTAPMPEGKTDFAIWFLNEAESGYCVHYATAATVLLRAAGIPARYVEGYKADARLGITTTVEEHRAHAWVEYYLDGAGWLILDPTPGNQEHDTPIPTVPTGPTIPSTSTNPTTQPSSTTQPSTTEPSSSVTTEPSVSTEPSPSTDPVKPGKQQAPGWIGSVFAVLAIMGGVYLAIHAQWYLRRRWKLKKMQTGTPNRQALARYQEAKCLARLSKQALPGALTELAEKACFSQHTLTQEELACFDPYIRSCTDALRETHWLYQLYCRVFFAAY